MTPKTAPIIPSEMKALLEKQQYEFCGSHSAVKICTWTKKCLRDEGSCYKSKFYGIKSHQCCQLSTTVGFCQNSCIFCWRDQSQTLGRCMPNPAQVDLDKPQDIIPKAFKAQQKLLSGFGGNDKANKQLLKEAQEPLHVAISLTGEPTLYPKLSELISELKEQGKSVFVVTNGMTPEELEKMEMPTQLYVSLDAPNEEIFKKVDLPSLPDAWERLNRTLELFAELDTRTAVRITLIKDVNMTHPEQYASLLEKASPMFVEVKAYMFVGASQLRLAIENMPRHREVKEFAKDICKHCSYRIIDEQEESRVVLLMKEDREDRIMKFD